MTHLSYEFFGLIDRLVGPPPLTFLTCIFNFNVRVFFSFISSSSSSSWIDRMNLSKETDDILIRPESLPAEFISAV